MSGENREGRNPDSGNTARGDNTSSDVDDTVETNTSSKSDPELIRGKVLGDKYEILAHLGSGAMGAVYKARHQILNKEVAIKVLQQENLKDKVKKERFMREAKAQGALTHRNIAAVHDFGLTEKDQPFFVMDFLKGQSLEEYLEKEKSLTCIEACQIFEQVARALQHAHSKKIVHRDLKPSNIMLIDSEDGELHALLVDFGIAVYSENEMTKLTKAGHVVGTPHYMSPEQITGKTLDYRSDFYSLGCVMFESLTGNVPFLGPNASATMALHLAQPPEHITSFKTKTPLSKELADLVMRCIEKRPEDRYANAKEIASLLNDIRIADEKREKETSQVSAKIENEDNLVGAGKGHQQNPAHAPSAIVDSDKDAEKLAGEGGAKGAERVSEKSAEKASEKIAEKIVENVSLKEAANDSIEESSQSADSSGTGPIENFAAETDRLNAKVSRDTNTLVSDNNKALPIGESNLSKGQTTPSSPTDSSIKQVQPAKEPMDLRISGHDKIRMIAVLITLVVFEPLYGRLALPIDPSEMRDDGPFFMVAKYLVELNNHMAHHIVWQWVVPVLLAVLVFRILNKLLQDADD